MSVYEIRVQGHLDEHWATWFEGLALTHDGDCTVLRGPLVDEAALYGVLAKVRDLHVQLLVVQAVEGEESASGAAVPVWPEADPPDHLLADVNGEYAAQNAKERSSRKGRRKRPS